MLVKKSQKCMKAQRKSRRTESDLVSERVSRSGDREQADRYLESELTEHLEQEEKRDEAAESDFEAKCEREEPCGTSTSSELSGL